MAKKFTKKELQNKSTSELQQIRSKLQKPKPISQQDLLYIKYKTRLTDSQLNEQKLKYNLIGIKNAVKRTDLIPSAANLTIVYGGDINQIRNDPNVISVSRVGKDIDDWEITDPIYNTTYGQNSQEQISSFTIFNQGLARVNFGEAIEEFGFGDYHPLLGHWEAQHTTGNPDITKITAYGVHPDNWYMYTGQNSINQMNPEWTPTSGTKFSNHGSQVSSVMIGDTNNEFGMTGTCPNCYELFTYDSPVTAAPPAVTGYFDSENNKYSTIIEMLELYLEQGVKVVNISRGSLYEHPDHPDDEYQIPLVTAEIENAAVTDAFNAGVLCIVSAGNSQHDLSIYPRRYCSYDHTLCVAGSEYNNTCYDSDGTIIDVSAPSNFQFVTGVAAGMQAFPEGAPSGIDHHCNPQLPGDQTNCQRSCVDQNGIPLYENQNITYDDLLAGNIPDWSNCWFMTSRGTSFGTPRVVGLAGLLLSHNPSLTASDLYNIITTTNINEPSTADTCVDEVPGWDCFVGEASADNCCSSMVQPEGPVPGEVNFHAALNEMITYPIQSIAGCLDPNACNWNWNATEDDGSCEYANIECWDGSLVCNSFGYDECPCEPYTCWDGSLVCNDFYNHWGIYEPCPAQCSVDTLLQYEYICPNGFCVQSQPQLEECFDCYFYGEDIDQCGAEWGCTDPDATNYHPNVIYDDGSCQYYVPNNCEQPVSNVTCYIAPDLPLDGVCLGATSGEVITSDTGIPGLIAGAVGQMITQTPYYCDGETKIYCNTDEDCPTYTGPPLSGCMDTYANNYNENANHDCSGQMDISDYDDLWYNFSCCQYNPPTGDCSCQCNCLSSSIYYIASYLGGLGDCMDEDHCESICTFNCDNYYGWCPDTGPEGWGYTWSSCGGLGRGETTKPPTPVVSDRVVGRTKPKLSRQQLKSMTVEELKRIKNELVKTKPTFLKPKPRPIPQGPDDIISVQPSMTAKDCERACGYRDPNIAPGPLRAKGGVTAPDITGDSCYTSCMRCAVETNPPCDFWGTGESRGCGGGDCGGNECFCPNASNPATLIEVEDCCAPLVHDSEHVDDPWIITTENDAETIGYFCHFSNHDWGTDGNPNSGAGVVTAGNCAPWWAFGDGGAFQGCTDPQACNYDAAANTDDGSCNYCNDTYSCTDDWDCATPACISVTGWAFWPGGTCNNEDGSCIGELVSCDNCCDNCNDGDACCDNDEDGICDDVDNCSDPSLPWECWNGDCVATAGDCPPLCDESIGIIGCNDICYENQPDGNPHIDPSTSNLLPTEARYGVDGNCGSGIFSCEDRCKVFEIPLLEQENSEWGGCNYFDWPTTTDPIYCYSLPDATYNDDGIMEVEMGIPDPSCGGETVDGWHCRWEWQSNYCGTECMASGGLFNKGRRLV